MKYLYAYRNIALPANIVTIICCYQAWEHPLPSELGMLILMKLFTTLLLILYIHLFRSDLIFFFMNIGFGRKKFYSVMLIADALVFTTAMTLATLIS